MKTSPLLWVAGIALTVLLLAVIAVSSRPQNSGDAGQPGALPAPAILVLTASALPTGAIAAASTTPAPAVSELSATPMPTATITPTPRPTHPSMDPAGKCSDCHSTAKQTPGATSQAKP
jgi:hypothetical protein